MKKIIYVMNVDWNWIKQRPHFIAEKLSKEYKVIVLYQYRYGRAKLQKRNEKNVMIKPIYTIPKITGIENLRWINDYIIAFFARRIINKEKPDYIYLTYPTQVNIIPKDFRGKIIYDCMDNHTAFIQNKNSADRLFRLENHMVQLVDVVFTSSAYLLKQIKNRYKESITNQVFSIVRNAYNGKIQSISEEFYEIGNEINLAYVGTIDSWFDFDSVIYALQNIENLRIHLFGPCNVIIPNHSRIEYHGILEHENIYNSIKSMDGLMMPFVINEIIEAVDPVKLYEYINFNKMIICSKYHEIERFNRFVEFYSSRDELRNIIINCVNKRQPKYTPKERITFLENNTWECRENDIVSILEE